MRNTMTSDLSAPLPADRDSHAEQQWFERVSLVASYCLDDAAQHADSFSHT